MFKNSFYILLGLVSTTIAIENNSHLQTLDPAQHIGLFKKDHPILNGIKWGNWGSRPYEYYWASRVVSVEGKRIIDLGVGLPSQYNWYQYVTTQLRPLYYVGIDTDTRILNELTRGSNYEMLHMDMSQLNFPAKSFDIAFCISTFEHIPYPIFIKAIQEAHRVLKDDGVLVFTLDEQWDKNIPITRDTGWNDLEQSLIKLGLFKAVSHTFGLPDFMNLIKEYFVPLTDDIHIDLAEKIISSTTTGAVYYQRNNRDANILASPELYNSCVSYAVVKKVTR